MGLQSNGYGTDAPMAEINTTPLVDVMLVLFVIFLVTAPMLTNTVPLNLPKEGVQIDTEKLPVQTVSVDASGQVFFNNVAMKKQLIIEKLKQTAAENPEQPFDLYIDENANYVSFSWLLLAASNAGLSQLGFVMQSK
tara:strand:- start:768 stop:1178 length:411 start_codon:yes stop_codon:yes gene_type:complete